MKIRKTKKPGTAFIYRESNVQFMVEPTRGEPRTPVASNDPKAVMPRSRPSLFKYYIHDGCDGLRLELTGEFKDQDVPEITGCWRTARTMLGERKLILDLRKLKAADPAGKRWIFSMLSEGAACLPDAQSVHALPEEGSASQTATNEVRKLHLLEKLLVNLRLIYSRSTQAQ